MLPSHGLTPFRPTPKFAEIMPGEAHTDDLPPPRPSVFVSYASADRAMARTLRDTLAAAGLDVWFDEDELAGGEAWDAKIRNQIRTCTYFMPVISETTQVRREGYFRREWRLAVDRSHDMADDATFLLPVVIDGTTEAGARVPEKFLTVQWLKLPGGQPTPALMTLAGRLARGEHVSPRPTQAPFVPPPPAVTRSPIPPPLHTMPPMGSAAAGPAPAPAPESHSGHPKLTPFPARPADRHDRLKYLVEIIAWLCTSAWIIFKWLPKWARFLIVVWLVIMAFRQSGSEPERPAHAARPASVSTGTDSDDKSDEDAAGPFKVAANHLDQVATDPAATELKVSLARAGAEIARAVSKEIAGGAADQGKLGIVTLAGHTEDPVARKFGKVVMLEVFSKLVSVRPGLAQLQPPEHLMADDAALRTQAAQKGETRLLVARIEGKELVVRLLAVAPPDEVWTGRYAVQGGDIAAAVAQIVQGVQAAIPPAPPVPPDKG